MRRDEFSYPLPEELIAQFPSGDRGESRLLCMNRQTGCLEDRQFSDLVDLLSPDDLLVLNDTRVIPARLFGHKATGGRVEIMAERILGESRLLAQMRFSKPPRTGTQIVLENAMKLDIIGRQGEMFVLELQGGGMVCDVLAEIGHMPLPPYIQRADRPIDQTRYQTVYARQPGAVAAPTAGLHFSNVILQMLEQRGIATAYLTLHVGAGTFQPVRTDNIEDHKMHSEYVEVSTTVCEKVNHAKTHGGRVIAVGTTSVRSLETAAQSGTLQPYTGETDIFITPGYDFKVVDSLITNFHLPESTLLMLVCAIAGRDNVLKAYQYAIDQHYRFFSYGDAMFITE
jgi:S-adenosylmethionine:tRNA ribosyltransferase-isomerase